MADRKPDKMPYCNDVHSQSIVKQEIYVESAKETQAMYTYCPNYDYEEPLLTNRLVKQEPISLYHPGVRNGNFEPASERFTGYLKTPIKDEAPSFDCEYTQSIVKQEIYVENAEETQSMYTYCPNYDHEQPLLINRLVKQEPISLYHPGVLTGNCELAPERFTGYLKTPIKDEAPSFDCEYTVPWKLTSAVKIKEEIVLTSSDTLKTEDRTDFITMGHTTTKDDACALQADDVDNAHHIPTKIIAHGSSTPIPSNEHLTEPIRDSTASQSGQMNAGDSFCTQKDQGILCSPLVTKSPSDFAGNCIGQNTKTDQEEKVDRCVQESKLHVQMEKPEGKSQFRRSCRDSRTEEMPCKRSTCDNTYPQKCNIDEHITKPTRKKPYLCSLCEYRCAFKYELVVHNRKHTGEKPFTCSLCDFRCRTKSGLVKHQLRHTKEMPHMCSACGHFFAQKRHLTLHWRTHTGEKPYKCSLCDYSSARKCDISRHMRSHTGEKPHKCSTCDHSCATKADLVKHMRTHTGEKRYKCSLCDYRCAKKSHLTQHVLVHTKEKPYKCTLCDYISARKGTLVEHMITHTKEKPYMCSTCGSRFGRKSDLAVHIKTHSGEKPYECPVCKISFAQSCTLASHKRTHTGEKPYKCLVCDRRFGRKSTLVIHMRIHTKV